jgi:eukaryotic-like serine/threonine-protein kinase
VAVNRELLKRSPGDAKVTRKLVASLWYSAVVHRTNMRDPEAKAAISEAYQLAQAWRARDPNDNGALQMTAITGEVYAQVLTDQKQYDEAERISDEVIAAHKIMVERAGDTPGALRSMTAALRTRGGNFYNAGRYDKACTAFQQAHDNYAALDRRGQLTKTDRDNGYAEMKDYLVRACNPPRKGLGDEI